MRAYGHTDGQPSVGFIEFAFGSFYVDCINALYNERVHGKEEHAT